MFENEYLEIVESVKKLSAREIPKYQREEFYGSVPRPLFLSFAELGLAGLAIEEGFGGIQATPSCVAAVMEEIAAVDLGCSIFLSVHSMVSGLIQRFGTKAQHDKYLSKMSSGEYLGAFALTEPQAGSDAAALRTQAKEQGNSFVLNGEKCYITSAGFADLYVVFAKTAPDKGKKGISAFIIDANAKGLKMGKPEKKMGAELSPIASLNFENCVVSKDCLLGELNNGYAVALSGLAGGRVNIAACANGISKTAIELALKHLKEREQFGEKLINFQGLQFMLSDLKINFEAARLLTERAAAFVEKNPNSKDSRIYSSMAKCFATDAAMKISTDAVQLLGGAGYIKEYIVERLMRDAKMLQIVEGTNQIQRLVIAREMAGQ